MTDPGASPGSPNSPSGSPATPRPTQARKEVTDDPSVGSPPDPLGWRSLTPSVSIAVFLTVAMFTLDSTGKSRIGFALTAGVLIGPLASYLFDTYWPRNSTRDSPAQPGSDPVGNPGPT